MSAQLRGRSGIVSPATAVAQLVEQGPFKPRVVSSILTGGTEQLPPRMRTKIAPRPCPRVDLPGPCWVWTAALTSRGYGCVGMNGRRYLSHRATYMLLVGPIPAGLELDHLCRNKVCCNPGHLEPVTSKTNSERSEPATKLRCIQGHPLAGPNLTIKSKSNGLTQRECRMCMMLRKQRLRAAAGCVDNPRRAATTAARRAKMLAESEVALAAITTPGGHYRFDEASIAKFITPPGEASA